MRDELLVVLERREDVERRAKEAEEHATELRIAVDRVAGDAARELSTVTTRCWLHAGTSARATRGRDRPGAPRALRGLRPQKKGVAAVALVDGVCQGCHEKLSSVELDRVKRTEGIARCEYCRRILVLLTSLIVWCDGAARGNSGPAGAGSQLTTPDGEVVAEISEDSARPRTTSPSTPQPSSGSNGRASSAPPTSCCGRTASS